MGSKGISLLFVFTLAVPVALLGCSENKPPINFNDSIEKCLKVIQKKGDQDPKVPEWQKPEYPEIARRGNMEGMVVILVSLGSGGEYLKGEICSGPNALLNKADLRASKQCNYVGARNSGEMVPSQLKVPFSFRLY